MPRVMFIGGCVKILQFSQILMKSWNTTMKTNQISQNQDKQSTNKFTCIQHLSNSSLHSMLLPNWITAQDIIQYLEMQSYLCSRGREIKETRFWVATVHQNITTKSCHHITTRCSLIKQVTWHRVHMREILKWNSTFSWRLFFFFLNQCICKAKYTHFCQSNSD